MAAFTNLAAVRDEVINVVNEYVSSLFEDDMEKILSYCTPHCTMIKPGGVRVIGREEVANLYRIMMGTATAWGCTNSNVYNVNIGGLNDDPWYSFSFNQVDDWGRAFRSFWNCYRLKRVRGELKIDWIDWMLLDMAYGKRN